MQDVYSVGLCGDWDAAVREIFFRVKSAVLAHGAADVYFGVWNPDTERCARLLCENIRQSAGDKCRMILVLPDPCEGMEEFAEMFDGFCLLNDRRFCDRAAAGMCCDGWIASRCDEIFSKKD